ncbi:lysozyme inhibitor LprI family protein [Roseisalinus antarcticus]|nr:lysozyme inhibitor LprI family protein [Roseisalinus antarcticus]
MGPLALVLALFLAAPDRAAAQDLDCSRSDLPQQAMNACAYREFEAADATLNAVWSDAIAFARSHDAGDALLSAQRAWLPYRDAACAAEAALFDGGSMAPLIRNTCLTALTEERTDHLRFFAEMGA